MPRRDGSVNISRPIAHFISELAVTRPEISSRDIHREALEIAKETGDKTLRRDQFQTVDRRVRLARQKLTEEDVQWSLGGNPVLLERLVEPSARHDVLDVSTWHLIGHTRFSFRQAKWVSRLRGSFASSNSDRLSFAVAIWASRYANQEKVSEAHGIDFDTSVLDIQLATSQRPREGTWGLGDFESLVRIDASRALNKVGGAAHSNKRRGEFSVLDELSRTVFDLCPHLESRCLSIPMVTDRIAFELLVLKIRREFGSDFLQFDSDRMSEIVDRMYDRVRKETTTAESRKSQLEEQGVSE